MMVIDDLRAVLHRALDDAIDAYARGDAATDSEPPRRRLDLSITPGDDTGPWTYRWPDGATEHFYASRWYRLDWTDGAASVRLAWTKRHAWGRERDRAIVFARQGGEDSSTYYPWAEFVETDTGGYAASIPNPSRPRSTLAAGAAVPPHVREAEVRRADEVFDSVRLGPSLRLVVGRDAVEAMLMHAHWVATVRRRL